VMKNPTDYDARANLFWAGTIAHNDVLGIGRVQDWASHQIEHELSALYDVAHGAGLAVVMPNFMRYTLDHDVSRYAQFAVRVFDCDPDFKDLRKTALEGIDRLSQFLKSIGMPLTFAEIGAKEDDIPLLVSKVRRNNQDSVGYFMPLSSADVEAVYRLCL
jgi:alcohol dehydrogenase YqhD (iron-dependent ADH family)